MNTYEYKIQNSRKIIKTDYLNAESLEEAHEKLIKDFPESIIWINGIRFPPMVKLENVGFKLSLEVKKEFDTLKGDETSNLFMKKLLECYKKNIN